MVRKTVVLLLVSLGGCVSTEKASLPGTCPGSFGRGAAPPQLPGVQGPWGQPVAMASPYSFQPPTHSQQAYAMMSRSVPLNMVQTGGCPGPGSGSAGMNPPSIMVPAGGLIAPPGLPFAPGIPPNSAPPTSPAPGSGIVQAQHLAPPGGGMAGPCPGPGMRMPHGPAMAGMPHIPATAAMSPYPAQRTQVRFVRPSGMKVAWFTQGLDGRPTFSSAHLEVPGRYNFIQGAIYRLKLSNFEGHPGLELYPTLEVVPANPKTAAFLAHSSVPVDFTEEDVKQITQGNYLVKVIYLPDPQFQELAGTGTEEILSTRLEPGADPIQEALRRGSILLVIRMGNVDQEAPNTPPFGAASPPQGLIPQAPPQGGILPMHPLLPPGPGKCTPPFCNPAMPPAGMSGSTSSPANGASSPANGAIGPNLKTNPAIAPPRTFPTSGSASPTLQPGGPAPITGQPQSGSVAPPTPKKAETVESVLPAGGTPPRPDTLPEPSLPSTRAPADGSGNPVSDHHAVRPVGAVAPAGSGQDQGWAGPAREVPPPLPSPSR